MNRKDKPISWVIRLSEGIGPYSAAALGIAAAGVAMGVLLLSLGRWASSDPKFPVANAAMIVTGTYDPVLVAVSIAVAVMASYAALELGGRILASKGWKRILWLAMSAVAMGGGIWSMHFIAMLAFVLPIPVEYDFKLTAISFLAAVIATGAGFYVVASEPLQRRRLAFGGMLIGAGIVGMHYTGMSAMLMRCSLRYDLLLLIASILIAVGAATTALWLAFRCAACLDGSARQS